ncbi:MAG: EamA family transporter RarD [Dinoroseobacter sp.]|nr:EamA family transporter RarD [Dinoroseobacter sp.]
MTTSAPVRNEDSLSGLAFAVSAYVFWGFLPLYMKMMDHIPAEEVLAHRVIWSVPVAGLVLIVLRRTDDLMAALRTPRVLAMGLLTSALISLNWWVYVWSIANDQAIDAALGYYINPLFSIALGAILLKEKLTRSQLIAIGLAAVAVAVLTYEAGSLPLVALTLTLSWGFYAYFRKTLPVGANQGFMLEVLILTPFALIYLAWIWMIDVQHFGAGVTLDTWLLFGCGLITAGPLMLYANGAKRLRLSTIGILQYIAPTMIFLVAVFVFEEPFGRGKAIAFPMIWLALIIYSTSMFRQMRSRG